MKLLTWNRENIGKRRSNFEVLRWQRRGEMRNERLKERCAGCFFDGGGIVLHRRY
ncbi:hypothetical protein A2U01_0063058 [Trifolium medium]|uniref:Uncharacterized protein n=1 Tax=Trifolium medium TaxID=97028 RepID=A0A392S0G5_9FABA|nr:hypothetical protein [Trifolium medium]